MFGMFPLLLSPRTLTFVDFWTTAITLSPLCPSAKKWDWGPVPRFLPRRSRPENWHPNMSTPPNIVPPNHSTKLVLAESAFTKTFKVADKRTDKILVIREISCPNAESQELGWQEACRQMKLRHPHILPLRNVYRGTEGSDCPPSCLPSNEAPSPGKCHSPTGLTLCLVSDFCELGNLDAFIGQSGGPSFADRDRVSRQLLEGLSYLFQENFPHRNLKPTNLFLRRDSDGRPTVLLADFADLRQMERRTRLRAAAGREEFTAPEMYAQGPCDQRADLFSVGLVLACLYGRMTSADLSGLLWPHAAWQMTEDELHKRIRERLLVHQYQVPPDVVDGILGLLSFDPAKRPLPGVLLESLFDPVARASPTPSPSAVILQHPSKAAIFSEEQLCVWLQEFVAAGPNLPGDDLIQCCECLGTVLGVPAAECPQAVEAVVTLLEHPVVTTSAAVANALYGALRNLSCNEKNQAHFGMLNAAVPIVRLLEHPTVVGHASVAEALYAALGNLSYHNEANKLAFGRAGCADPIVRLLVHPVVTGNASVATVLFGALQSLSLNEENRAAFHRAGVVTPVMKLLEHQVVVTNPEVAVNFYWALRLLSLHPDNKTALLRAGVAHSLAALQRHPFYAKIYAVRAMIAFTIDILSRGDPQSRFALESAGVYIPKLE
ncbi:putative Protein kinase domain [Paratrimastix pyriformis]|uniref:Protein kinase domain-containing protein n=1 Tax=Paratrimastix pyriformis TaxID=342808 RepID=A0ABQ8UNB5_9EUKA|nr:putative Protein kinase domain [Paratrimastix pyriformis]